MNASIIASDLRARLTVSWSRCFSAAAPIPGRWPAADAPTRPAILCGTPLPRRSSSAPDRPSPATGPSRSSHRSSDAAPPAHGGPGPDWRRGAKDTAAKHVVVLDRLGEGAFEVVGVGLAEQLVGAWPGEAPEQHAAQKQKAQQGPADDENHRPVPALSRPLPYPGATPLLPHRRQGTRPRRGLGIHQSIQSPQAHAA